MSLFWCCLHYGRNTWLVKNSETIQRHIKNVFVVKHGINYFKYSMNIWGEEASLFKGWEVFILCSWVHVYMWVFAHTCTKFTYSIVQIQHVIFFYPLEMSSFDTHTLKSLRIIILSHQPMKTETEESYNNELRCKS